MSWLGQALNAMDDVVAVRVDLVTGEAKFFLTWGRAFDPVDPTELLAAVASNLDAFDLGATVASVTVCPSLQDAAGAKYFFENLLAVSRTVIPRGEEYAQWAEEMREKIRNGKELYLLG